MRLTYWRAERLDDSDCYGIRERTKKAAEAALAAAMEDSGGSYRPEFGPIEKVVLEYRDGFELMDACLSEDRGSGLQINGERR